MEQTLSSFLDAYREKAWHASTVNCLFFPAAWALWLGYRDPVARWRGVVRDDDHMRAILQEAGGAVPLVAEAAAGIGLASVEVPQCGDIGVIGSASNIQRQFGAIFDGERWLVRFISTIGPMSAPVLKVWRV